MKKLIIAILAGAAIGGMVLGVYWLLWQLWCWVMPQLWTTGPENFVRPGFWLFAAAWFLLMAVGRGVFGGRKD
jgi:hypothetical protein